MSSWFWGFTVPWAIVILGGLWTLDRGAIGRALRRLDERIKRSEERLEHPVVRP